MPHMQAAKKAMSTLIDTLAGMKDTGIAEIAQLGRTMNKRRKDTLAYFDHKVSNGPVEAINGPPRIPTRYRPGILQPQLLHLAVSDPRRQHPTQNQCTLKSEEPVKPSNAVPVTPFGA